MKSALQQSLLVPVARAASLALLLGVGTASAQIVANFTGGAGTISSDQYSGAAGNGWASAWQTSNTTGTVSTATPLNGGGNYLSVTTTASVTGDAAVRRQFSAANGVNLSSPVRLTFDYRFDTALGVGTTFSGANDYVSISTNAASNAASPLSDSAFIIRAYSTNVGAAVANTWAFYNGVDTGTGLDTSRWQNSGMALVTGTVYTFTIDIIPNANAASSGQIGTYNVSIFNGSTTVSATALNWRNNVNTTVPTWLVFNGRDSATTESVSFSLDNISIAAVPEPSAFAALAGLGALGLVALRRRPRG